MFDQFLEFTDDEDDNFLLNLIFQKLNSKIPNKRRKRIHDRHINYNNHENSAISQYYLAILNDPSDNGRKFEEFRKQFSIPFEIVQNLINYTDNSAWFKSLKGKRDALGNKSIPTYLLILETLKLLTKGCHFSSLVIESTMSISSIQVFFHLFCYHFSIDNYDNYITYPKTPEEISQTEGIYRLVGLPGCIGSTDCVHIGWNVAPASCSQEYKGASGKPTISYEFSVDHHKKIMAVTKYKLKITILFI